MDEGTAVCMSLGFGRTVMTSMVSIIHWWLALRLAVGRAWWVLLHLLEFPK